MANLKDSLFVILETLIQTVFFNRLLARLIRLLALNENEKWKNAIIRRFGKRYQINTKEAESRNLNHYPHFDAFFTRKLKPDARSVTDINLGIACPVDGTVTQAGLIHDGAVVQAKGKNFTVAALLGGQGQMSDLFNTGAFATIYLSPKDYHRVHMPFNGTLTETVHIPGRLFNITDKAVNSLPDLYAKNERVVSFFDTESGPMAVVMVGSIFSSSIETVWDGVITPPRHSEIRHWNHPYNPPSANKGEELGCFHLGSTVILLFANQKLAWETDFVEGRPVKMGELIGKIA